MNQDAYCGRRYGRVEIIMLWLFGILARNNALVDGCYHVEPSPQISSSSLPTPSSSSSLPLPPPHPPFPLSHAPPRLPWGPSCRLSWFGVCVVSSVNRGAARCPAVSQARVLEKGRSFETTLQDQYDTYFPIVWKYRNRILDCRRGVIPVDVIETMIEEHEW